MFSDLATIYGGNALQFEKGPSLIFHFAINSLPENFIFIKHSPKVQWLILMGEVNHVVLPNFGIQGNFSKNSKLNLTKGGTAFSICCYLYHVLKS